MNSRTQWTPRLWLLTFGLTLTVLIGLKVVGATELPNTTLVMFAMGGVGFAHFYDIVTN